MITADREPPYGNEPTRERILRTHDVDGMSFIVFDSRIQGVGWQGRYIKFLPDELDVITQLLQQIPVIATPGGSTLNVKQGKGRSLTFRIHQEDGWVRATDQLGIRRVDIANSDVPAIAHVLGEFNALRQGADLYANHFCEKYGTEDDD